MPSRFHSPSKVSLKDVKTPFKKRRLSASSISPPFPVAPPSFDPSVNFANSSNNFTGANQRNTDSGILEKPTGIIKLGIPSPPLVPPKSPSPPPVPPKSPPHSRPLRHRPPSQPLLSTQSQLQPQRSTLPEKSLPNPTKNSIFKMVAKSVSMPSLHSTTNVRGSENALRRTHAIEEAEAKGKGQVKNNGKANYKSKDTRQSSSKAPDGFKDNPRWKKVTKEKIKPVPKSQEKVKSPKQGILKFGRKETNPTLNSNSEIVGKKKSKGKVAQDVPRRVRFHHAPPTPPVSAVSCGSRDAKRNRSGGVITSAESLRFPMPSVLTFDIANQSVDSMLDQMLAAQANYKPTSPIAFPTAIPTPLETAGEVGSCPSAEEAHAQVQNPVYKRFMTSEKSIPPPPSSIDTYSQAHTYTSTADPVSDPGTGYGSTSPSLLSTQYSAHRGLSISGGLGIETAGIAREVLTPMENMRQASKSAIPDSQHRQGMPVISVEMVDDQEYDGNSYPHFAAQGIPSSFTNSLQSTSIGSKKDSSQTIVPCTHSTTITPWYDASIGRTEPASPALSAISSCAVIGNPLPSHSSPYPSSGGHFLSLESEKSYGERLSCNFEPISKIDNPRKSALMVELGIDHPHDEALAQAPNVTTTIAARTATNTTTETRMPSIPSLLPLNQLKQPRSENSSAPTPVISPSMSESSAAEILLTPMDHHLHSHTVHSMAKISSTGDGINGGAPGEVLTMEESLMYKALFARAFQRGFLTVDDLKGEKTFLEALIPGGHWSNVDHGVAKEMVVLRRENARLKTQLAVSEDIVESQRAELSAFLNSPKSSYSQGPCSPSPSPLNSPSRKQGLKITIESPNVTPRRLRYINSSRSSPPTSRGAKYNHRKSVGVDYLINEVCQLRTELEITRDRQEQWQHRAEMAETHRERAEESVAAMQAMFGRVMEDLDEARRRSQMTREENDKARSEMEEKRVKGEMAKVELRKRDDKELLEKEKMKVKVKIMEKKIEGYNEAVRMFKNCLVEVAQLREQRSGLEQELFHLRTDYGHLSFSTTASIKSPPSSSPASLRETKGHPHSQKQRIGTPSSTNVSTGGEDRKEEGSLTPIGLAIYKRSQSSQPSSERSKASAGLSRPSFWKLSL
ncbi:hypothetical protein J007_02004, partial [Cryptococcus neoformans]